MKIFVMRNQCVMPISFDFMRFEIFGMCSLFWLPTFYGGHIKKRLVSNLASIIREPYQTKFLNQNIFFLPIFFL